MKDFFSKYKIIIIYVLIIGVLLQLFFRFSENLLSYILLLVSFFFIALLIRKLLSFLKRKSAALLNIIASLIDKYKANRYENMLTASSESWRIRGKDTGALKLRLGLAERIRSALNIRTRLTLRLGASNIEKVRYIFTRFILERSGRDYIILSSTPRELLDNFSNERDEGVVVLADAYEIARYSDAEEISDGTVAQCDTLVKNGVNKRL